jgi:hypothetical protein
LRAWVVQFTAIEIVSVDQCLSDVNNMENTFGTAMEEVRLSAGHGGVAYTPHILDPCTINSHQMRSSPAERGLYYVSRWEPGSVLCFLSRWNTGL